MYILHVLLIRKLDVWVSFLTSINSGAFTRGPMNEIVLKFAKTIQSEGVDITVLDMKPGEAFIEKQM